MDFRPDQPMHNRYAVSHGFLLRVGRVSRRWRSARIVNAFFYWEFNSRECSCGERVYPIDYANACPDVAVTSLHYYFPWAITALVRWSTYCVVNRPESQRRPARPAGTSRSPTSRLSYDEKLDRLPRAGRRVLRDRALPGVVREHLGTWRSRSTSG